MTAVEWLENEFQEIFKEWGGLDTHWIKRFEQSKEMENIEKLKLQLFMGKVSEIIGMDKTIELWKECI